MNDYEKIIIDQSARAVSEAEKERIKKERHQNRFNYYNSTIATIALILSIIALLK